MTKLPHLASLGLAGVLCTASTTWAACFTIYDAKNVVVYQSTEPPIDLSQRIGAQMAQRYPRQFLVMADSDDGCALIGPPARPAQFGTENAEVAVMDSPLFRNAESSISSISSSASGNYSMSWGYPFTRGGGGSPGTDVSVRTYMRSNGTVVQSHTRAAPGRGR